MAFSTFAGNRVLLMVARCDCLPGTEVEVVSVNHDLHAAQIRTPYGALWWAPFEWLENVPAEPRPEHVRRAGDRVYIPSEGRLGTVVEHVPGRGGYMVQVDGASYAGGFGYSELAPVPRTVWDWLLGDLVF